MAAMSRGLATRPRPAKHTKGGTLSSRKHRFEPFSQRIAKLKIEPIRRGRSTILDDAELENAFSYFRTALDEWRDLNVSEAFTTFARKVAPLCESLPQVLHHHERILELLVQHIEKGDKWSEEPLLSLLAHFAHDLGERFEAHFERAVKTVAHLAAKHADVEVIEWSFTCLAWLFKYLSRLLVPDLRPTFDLMAPLLGMQHQKPFVTRFAADSLSFLVRKAGAAYQRDKTPLRLIVRHMSEQLEGMQGSGKDDEFQQGLMSLLADSMKGVQRGMHSSAVAILREMLLQSYHDDYASHQVAPMEPVLLGVLTAILHHSDADNFQPLLSVVVAQIETTVDDACWTSLSARLLLVCCGVRRGSRISSWKPVLELLGPLLDTADRASDSQASILQNLPSTIAVTFQYCPLDEAIPYVQLLEALTRSQWEKCFLSFCTLFADLGVEKFQSLLLPFFKRFVTQKAHEHSNELLVTLPALEEVKALPKSSITLSSRFFETLQQAFKKLAASSGRSSSEGVAYDCSAFLNASEGLDLPQETEEIISDSLLDALRSAVRVKGSDLIQPKDILASGDGLSYILHHSRSLESLLELWPSLCQIASLYVGSPHFWQALLALLERSRSQLDLAGPHVESLRKPLIQAIGSPSHNLRLATLGVLELLVQSNETLREVVSTALLIEQTPISLDNERAISMRIRQLAKMYPAVCSDVWVGEAVPTYCFGLLHVKFAKAWDDSTSALKEMCETKEGETHVSRLGFEWISHNGTIAEPAAAIPESRAKKYYRATEFECTNVMQIHDKISKARELSADVENKLKDVFAVQHEMVPLVTSFSRTQALRVLNAIPQMAEKRSRLLVPVLIRWALDQPVPVSADDASSVTAAEEDPISQWARKDQKSMLSVFAKFVNPKVLYRSEEVYDALLALLCNGDVEIQKAALKAILTWKDPAITRYQENLHNLLDDARFREEISVFMDVGKEDSHLQEEHRDQLLPVILRLLYGKVISGSKGQEAKRKAVFIALTRFEADAIRRFLNIAFGSLSDISLIRDGRLNSPILESDLMSPRKQLGMLNMLEDMLDTLKTTLMPFASVVIDPLLYCLIQASRGVQTATPGSEPENDGASNAHLSLLKTIRQRGFHSLNILFESYPEFSWESYMPVIVGELVNPRLHQFPIETAQSVSGLLRLFAAWSESLNTAIFLVQYNADILHKVNEILDVSSAKDEVKQYVLDNVLRRLITLVGNSGDDTTATKLLKNRIQSDVLQPYSNVILLRVGNLLRKSPSKDLLEAGVHTIAELAPHVAGSAESRNLVEIATFLVKQPSKRVNFQTKLGLLRILHEFIPRSNSTDLDELFSPVFDAICPLLSSFRGRASRDILCAVINDLSQHREDLTTIAEICQDLNSYSTSRLDEPDFARRSAAFDSINGDQFRKYSLEQWQPLLYNMLYLIKDNEELSIRVNASLSLRRFVEASAEKESLTQLLSSALLPGIQTGMREASELVRTEYLAVLSHLVTLLPQWPAVADLQVLLSAEEESSFFGNVLHIQSHRRLRALRRLASSASQLQASNIYHVLLPLIEHFIFNKAEDEGAHNLAGEAIRTVAALTEWLEWPQFRSLLKRYVGYLASKEDMQKTMIKLLGGIMDALNQAGRSKGYASAAQENVQQNALDGVTDQEAMAVNTPLSTLAKTLPQQERLMKDLTENFLPNLTEFLHKKDESTVSLRVPIAVAVTKVILVLPPREIEIRLPPLLLDICNILKSRSEDARGMARNTLSDIAMLTGPKYLTFILKSLRTALQRGYQLHVLSFTMHHILVKMSPELAPGDLNHCLDDMVDVIMDDIFGVTGQEKDAEEYISKMKEVKSSKSYDSMDILARSTTPSHLVRLVLPIKSLLLERLNAKIVNKIDELLRRIGLGVLQNTTVKDRDILVFCYELIQEVYKANAKPDEVAHGDSRNRRYLINMKGAPKSGVRGSSSSYLYKITRFSLDILRTVLRKHEELLIPQNVAGFLPIIGDALVQGQEEVQVSAIRLLTTIIKVPLPTLDKDCPVYVTEAVRLIRNAPSTNTEIAQASLKMISAVIRERPNVSVKDYDVGRLLKRLLPDLDEPDRQGVTFGFIKAIMSRKIQTPELYEVMDKVAEMMVTNQTRSARDLSRSNYFHFLMEYPQAKNRWRKQLEFLIKNLRYDYIEGRQSVMEALNLLLSKVGDEGLQDALGMMFLPLINSMANDDSSDCRTMAGALVSKVFERADSQRLKDIISDLRTWLEQDEDIGLKRLSIQCWGLYFEATETKPKEITFVLGQLQATIEGGLQRRDEDDWELIYYSLTVFSKLSKLAPDSTFASDKELFWTAIQSCNSYPHTWVKLTAAKLIGQYFADFATTNGDGGLGSLPLVGSQGLYLTEESMIRLTNAFLKNLSIPSVTEELCTQSVRNLAFLARCLAINGALWNWRKVDDDDDVEDTVLDDTMTVQNGDASSSDEEFSGFSPPPTPPADKTTSPTPTAIYRLMVRLSGIIRRETKIMKLSSLFPKTAVMTLLETLINKLTVESLTTSLPHVLTTLSTLTDPATTVPRSTDPAFNDTYKALIDKAREVMSTLQKRMGTQEYLKIMQGVQTGVKQRREDRRSKRKVEAVTAPEKYGKEKRRRNEIKRERRKEKSAENRGKRRGW
ncbi:armadillo-type protein [Lophiotrema nucula]|uniref:Armadillo-type protein n=1 Tax=Lophiotrema nucula TaxID=690887 RepID=A0A6A5YMU4_9PLEO|nr:armadillo-type protein [Lophiotrema nucula]